MTVAGTLVQRAFREGNLIPVGTQPTAPEAVEGLDVLNSLMLSTFGFTIGNRITDWQVPARQRSPTAQVTRSFPLLPGAERSVVPTYPLYPPLNTRVIWDGSAQTIYFDEVPQDGAAMAVAKGSGSDGAVAGTLTIDGNGRTIAGVNTVDSTTLAFPTQWFYRADAADWRVVQAVIATDDNLFPDKLDDLWVCAVAIRLAPRYGKTIGPGTSARFVEMSQIFRTTYQATAPTSSGGEDMLPTAESFLRSGMSWMW